MNWLKSIFSGIRSTLGSMFDGLFGDGALDSMSKKITSSGMTGADKEAAATQLENQQILNEQEYQRKIDFYEMYESPQAQVRQIKQAGLNPALMYGGAPSVSASGGIGSAGSANASASASEGFSSLVSAISGIALQAKQLELRSKEIDNDFKLGQRNADIVENWYNAQKPRVSAEAAQAIELTRGAKIDNDLKEKILPVLEQQAQVDLEFRLQQTVESRKRVDDLDSQIESRRHQNKHFDAQVAQLYSLVAQQNYYTQMYLPGMLSNDTILTTAQKGELEQRANESLERQKEIKELTKKAAAEAGIKEKDLENWVWLNSRPTPWHTQFYGETEYEAPPLPESTKPSRARQNYNPWF